MTGRGRRERGGALLAVLWLTAALSAIAFSVAVSVRGEIERTATSGESVRAYYLACGAVERAMQYMLWSDIRNPDGTLKYFEAGQPRLTFQSRTGVATVEVIPESSKAGLNTALPADIVRLLLSLGVERPRAAMIAAAIVDWRTPSPQGPSAFDQEYMLRSPSFHARHASFEEIEELLLVKGMTPELFYGTYTRDSEGRLVATGALRDCVSVYATGAGVDVNTAEPAVLSSLQITPDAVAAILQRRHAAPFKNITEVQTIAQGGGPGVGRLRIGGATLYTLRATAQLRLPNGQLSDLRRSVSAMIKLREVGYFPPIETLRWYDN